MPSDFTQSSEQFLASLDAEIERLQQMREQIAAALGTQAKAANIAKVAKRKGMSAEGRLRIAEAQKARWAKQKNLADSPASGKKQSTARKGVVKKAASKKAGAKKAATKQSAAKTAPES